MYICLINYKGKNIDVVQIENLPEEFKKEAVAEQIVLAYCKKNNISAANYTGKIVFLNQTVKVSK